MSGETYTVRYGGGFVDGSGGGTPVDSTFLNAVETALLYLLGEDPAANEVPVWSSGSARFVFQKIANAQIDAAAAIDKTKLGALSIVNADVSGAAAISQSKIALDIVNANVNAAAAIEATKIAWGYAGSVASGSAIAVTPNATHLLTGTTAVNTMTGGVTGCIVTLVASGQATGVCVVLNHATSTNNLSLRDSANFGLYAGESMTFIFDGTKWVEIDRDVRTVIDYAQITSNASITATSEGTANAAITGNSITFDGATPFLFEFYTRVLAKGTSDIRAILYDGSGSLGQIAYSTSSVTIVASRRYTPAAGAKTHSIRAYVDAGTGTVEGAAGGSGSTMPAFLRISRDV